MNTPTLTQPRPSATEVTAVLPTTTYAGRHRYGYVHTIADWITADRAELKLEGAVAARRARRRRLFARVRPAHRSWR